MADAVLRVLQWATGGAGVTVIWEDLHWADDATLAVIRYLVDHKTEVPALVLATVRTGEGREDVGALLEAGGAQVCPIGRLTDDETREMAAACAAAGSWPAESITAVVRDAEGPPLLVEDLLATGDLGGGRTTVRRHSASAAGPPGRPPANSGERRRGARPPV